MATGSSDAVMMAYWATDGGGLELPCKGVRELGSRQLAIGRKAAAILRRELGDDCPAIVFNLHVRADVYHGCTLDGADDIVAYIRRETASP